MGPARGRARDEIDLYQLHRLDPAIPTEESVGALADLQREGKIRHIGVSNFDLGQLERGQTVASIVSIQNRYNLTEGSSEAVLDHCERSGLAFIPWTPLNAGPLTAPGGQLESVAGAHRATPGQIALAWLLQRSPVIVVTPGTSRVSHPEENVAAAGIELTAEELAALDES